MLDEINIPKHYASVSENVFMMTRQPYSLFRALQ